jgi:hypothetical protein
MDNFFCSPGFGPNRPKAMRIQIRNWIFIFPPETGFADYREAVLGGGGGIQDVYSGSGNRKKNYSGSRIQGSKRHRIRNDVMKYAVHGDLRELMVR